MPLTRLALSTLISAHPHLALRGEACNARVGRQLCYELKPDLIVLDVAVRNGDGIELIREFKKLSASTKVIILSEAEDSLSIVRAFRAGAWGYVIKDEEPAELFAALEAVMNGGKFMSNRAAEYMANELHGSSDIELDDNFKKLSDRELHLLRRLGSGQGPKSISEELGISVKTVETHFLRMKIKMNVRTTEQLRSFAKRLRWKFEEPRS